MYDVKVQDDKFCLIAKMDETAKVVVKTPCGLTDEFSLERIVRQGSFFRTQYRLTHLEEIVRVTTKECSSIKKMFLFSHP